MLFDIISLLEVLIAAVYFFAFLFLDALNFSLTALACGLSLSIAWQYDKLFIMGSHSDQAHGICFYILC